MTIININATQPSIAFSIGRRGENEVTQVNFDYGAWVREFGAGVVTLLVKRSADSSAYPVNLTTADNVAAWLVTSTDTEYVGRGRLEFKYTVDEQVKKSVLFGCNVAEDIGAPSSTPPDPYETWLDTLTDLEAATLQNAQNAAESASAAASAQSAIENMTVSSETLEPGSPATVEKTEVGGVVNLNFGIPKGDKGQKGNTGAKGEDGAPGEDGYSPTVTVTEITGGHQVTITDVDGDHTFDVMDGTGGGGGTSNYNDLSNKPQIAGVTLSGNKSLADLGIAAAEDIPTVPVQSVNGQTGAVVLDASDVGAYELPSGGVPKTDLASDVQTSLGKADSALQSAPVTSVNNKTGAVTLNASDVGAYSKPSGGIPKTDLDSAVQTSLGKADTALQSAPVTSVNGQTGAVSLTIPSTATDVGAIAAPSSPSIGDFLCYTANGWAAVTVPSASGVSF